MKKSHWNLSCFFSAIQDKQIIYKERWYIRGSAFIHYFIDNFPKWFLGSIRGVCLIAKIHQIRNFWNFHCLLAFSAKNIEPNFILSFISMFFVAFEKSIYFSYWASFSKVWLSKGGSRGKNLLVSFQVRQCLRKYR